MSTKPSKALVRAAQRAIASEFFLAGILYEYQKANNLDDEALATQIECNVNDLTRLALCRRPTSSQSEFVSDIEHLAQRFHLRADQLAIIIRQVDSLHTLRQHLTSTQSSQGTLRAARDRDDNSLNETEKADD